jgi:LVIVD repeat
MRSSFRLAVACVVTALGLALVTGAVADPGDDGHADEIGAPPPVNPLTPPGSSNMQFLDAVDNDGTINSDLAFYGDLAFVGSYDRFRVVDISNPSSLRVLSTTSCRANQGDLSVFKADDGRLFMLQSIDRAVTAPDCTATDTATTTENEEGHTVTRNRFGYEGLRLFDVTDPANPEFVAFYRTACGSHTHTLVPDGDEVHAYIASYPLGSQITPKIDRRQADALGLACEAPHSKISIVDIPLGDPANGVVRETALSSDTEFYDGDGPRGHAPPFQACHDHQAFLPRNIMVASCAGDLQYWDISDRGDPTSADGEPHTHIQREVREDDPATPENERWPSFDFMHNATVSWDGAVVAAVDESGGGVESRCDGDDTKRGFTWFYPLVEPGTAVDGFSELGRYIIPRAQGTEVCVSHNGNVLPTTDGSRQQVQAFYQGGNTWFDFTNPATAHEVGFADLEKKQLGAADSWSSYWYNDVLWVNGGLNRRGGSGNRGFEAYALTGPGGGRLDLANWDHLNPQTQEAWQAP